MSSPPTGETKISRGPDSIPGSQFRRVSLCRDFSLALIQVVASPRFSCIRGLRSGTQRPSRQRSLKLRSCDGHHVDPLVGSSSNRYGGSCTEARQALPLSARPAKTLLALRSATSPRFETLDELVARPRGWAIHAAEQASVANISMPVRLRIEPAPWGTVPMIRRRPADLPKRLIHRHARYHDSLQTVDRLQASGFPRAVWDQQAGGSDRRGRNYVEMPRCLRNAC